MLISPITRGARLRTQIFVHFVQMGAPNPPWLFRNASAMPKNPIKAATGCDLRPLFVNWGGGGCALLNLPRFLVMQTQCETNPAKGCKKLGVLIFVYVLLVESASLFDNASALLNKGGQLCGRSFVFQYASIRPNYDILSKSYPI